MIYELILITVLTFIASIIGTISGFGVSATMIPILLSIIKPTEVLLLVGIIHIWENFWKIILFRHGIIWWLVLSFGIAGMIASFVGASLALYVPTTLLIKIVGLCLALYALLTFMKVNLPIKKNAASMVIGGIFSGFSEGISGIGGVIRAAFLNTLNLEPISFIATSGVIALVMDVTRIAIYLAGGFRLESFLVAGLLIFIPVSFLGTYVARFFVAYLSSERFHTIVTVFIFLMSLKLLLF